MTASPRAVLGELLDELDRLARVTETGPWHTAEALWRPPVVSSPSARFIAACSPERILQLVALARAGMEDTARSRDATFIAEHIVRAWIADSRVASDDDPIVEAAHRILANDESRTARAPAGPGGENA